MQLMHRWCFLLRLGILSCSKTNSFFRLTCIFCCACVVGKSSLLNALLGEEDVLPTNGMRACTASVIEVSYAPPPEGHMYVGEVQFMTQQVRRSAVCRGSGWAYHILSAGA